MPHFIFAHDGTAVNVAHIVTISVRTVDKPEGYVVRCRTTLSDGQYAVEGAVLNLSGILADKVAAQTYLDAIVKDLLNADANASA